MNIPARLKSYPEIAEAAAAVERATRAATAAERVFVGCDCKGVPAPLPAFDEVGAGGRLALAKAHDVVHGTGEAEKVAAAIEAERIGHAARLETSEAERAQAAATLAAARQAHEAAQSVLHAARNDLHVALTARADQVLPEMVAEALDAAKALSDLSSDIRSVALAARPGGSLSIAYLELGLPGAPLDGGAVTKLGGKIGGSRSTAAAVFEG